MRVVEVIGIVVLFVGLLYVFQGHLIYFPSKYARRILEEVQRLVVQLDYTTSEGRQTAFYWYPRGVDGVRDKRSPAEVWLLFGGNASTALGWLYFLEHLPSENRGFLLVDYPGYGNSEGRPTPETIRESTEKAFVRLQEYLKEQERGEGEAWKEPEVSVLGHSLGAAVALDFAARHPVKRVVIISPFTTMTEMAKRSVGVPLCYLLRHRLDNRARLRELVQRDPAPKIRIIHGERDEIIPVRMGRELAQMFPDKISYQEIPGGDHNGILSLAEEEIIAAMQGDS